MITEVAGSVALFPGSSQAFIHCLTEKLRKSVEAEASHQDGAASILQRLVGASTASWL